MPHPKAPVQRNFAWPSLPGLRVGATQTPSLSHRENVTDQL
jgi:hypothetical protein